MARPLAPEELRPGLYVAPLHYMCALPSYLWAGQEWNLPPDELVRLRVIDSDPGPPLRVRRVCLPFVLVRHADGRQQTLDVRTCQLARIDAAFAKAAWKPLKK